jgi:hypothetical protein
VHDYQLALQLNETAWIYSIMNQALDAMVRLELPQQSLYTKCMLFNQLILRYQFMNGTPVWKLFKQDPSAFNEEIGETMLSVLARSTSGSPNKLELDKVKKMFSRINKLSEISHTFERSLLAKHIPKEFSSGVEQDSAGDEVTRTEWFLSILASNLSNKSLKIYDSAHIETLEEAVSWSITPVHKLPGI